MVAFATLEEVKAGLRILPEETDDDALLTLLTDAATALVANYLKSAADPYLAGESAVSAEIKTATIMLVGYLYEPDKDKGGTFEPGYLPGPIVSMLYPLRDPALA